MLRSATIFIVGELCASFGASLAPAADASAAASGGASSSVSRSATGGGSALFGLASAKSKDADVLEAVLDRCVRLSRDSGSPTSDPALRAVATNALARLLDGAGPRGLKLHAPALKHLATVSSSDRAHPVRLAVGPAIQALAVSSCGFASVTCDSLLKLALKGLSDPHTGVRLAHAQALASVLATSVLTTRATALAEEAAAVASRVAQLKGNAGGADDDDDGERADTSGAGATSSSSGGAGGGGGDGMAEGAGADDATGDGSAGGEGGDGSGGVGGGKKSKGSIFSRLGKGLGGKDGDGSGGGGSGKRARRSSVSGPAGASPEKGGAGTAITKALTALRMTGGAGGAGRDRHDAAFSLVAATGYLSSLLRQAGRIAHKNGIRVGDVRVAVAVACASLLRSIQSCAGGLLDAELNEVLASILSALRPDDLPACVGSPSPAATAAAGGAASVSAGGSSGSTALAAAPSSGPGASVPYLSALAFSGPTSGPHAVQLRAAVRHIILHGLLTPPAQLGASVPAGWQKWQRLVLTSLLTTLHKPHAASGVHSAYLEAALGLTAKAASSSNSDSVVVFLSKQLGFADSGAGSLPSPLLSVRVLSSSGVERALRAFHWSTPARASLALLSSAPQPQQQAQQQADVLAEENAAALEDFTPIEDSSSHTPSKAAATAGPSAGASKNVGAGNRLSARLKSIAGVPSSSNSSDGSDDIAHSSSSSGGVGGLTKKLSFAAGLKRTMSSISSSAGGGNTTASSSGTAGAGKGSESAASLQRRSSALSVAAGSSAQRGATAPPSSTAAAAAATANTSLPPFLLQQPGPSSLLDLTLATASRSLPPSSQTLLLSLLTETLPLAYQPGSPECRAPLHLLLSTALPCLSSPSLDLRSSAITAVRVCAKALPSLLPSLTLHCLAVVRAAVEELSSKASFAAITLGAAASALADAACFAGQKRSTTGSSFTRKLAEAFTGKQVDRSGLAHIPPGAVPVMTHTGTSPLSTSSGGHGIPGAGSGTGTGVVTGAPAAALTRLHGHAAALASLIAVSCDLARTRGSDVDGVSFVSPDPSDGGAAYDEDRIDDGDVSSGSLLPPAVLHEVLSAASHMLSFSHKMGPSAAGRAAAVVAALGTTAATAPLVQMAAAAAVAETRAGLVRSGCALLSCLVPLGPAWLTSAQTWPALHTLLASHLLAFRDGQDASGAGCGPKGSSSGGGADAGSGAFALSPLGLPSPLAVISGMAQTVRGGTGAAAAAANLAGGSSAGAGKDSTGGGDNIEPEAAAGIATARNLYSGVADAWAWSAHAAVVTCLASLAQALAPSVGACPDACAQVYRCARVAIATVTAARSWPSGLTAAGGASAAAAGGKASNNNSGRYKGPSRVFSDAAAATATRLPAGGAVTHGTGAGAGAAGVEGAAAGHHHSSFLGSGSGGGGSSSGASSGAGTGASSTGAILPLDNPSAAASGAGSYLPDDAQLYSPHGVSLAAIALARRSVMHATAAALEAVSALPLHTISTLPLRAPAVQAAVSILTAGSVGLEPMELGLISMDPPPLPAHQPPSAASASSDAWPALPKLDSKRLPSPSISAAYDHRIALYLSLPNPSSPSTNGGSGGGLSAFSGGADGGPERWCPLSLALTSARAPAVSSALTSLFPACDAFSRGLFDASPLPVGDGGGTPGVKSGSDDGASSSALSSLPPSLVALLTSAHCPGIDGDISLQLSVASPAGMQVTSSSAAASSPSTRAGDGFVSYGGGFSSSSPPDSAHQQLASLAPLERLASIVDGGRDSTSTVNGKLSRVSSKWASLLSSCSLDLHSLANTNPSLVGHFTSAAAVADPAVRAANAAVAVLQRVTPFLQVGQADALIGALSAPLRPVAGAQASESVGSCFKFKAESLNDADRAIVTRNVSAALLALLTSLRPEHVLSGGHQPHHHHQQQKGATGTATAIEELDNEEAEEAPSAPPAHGKGGAASSATAAVPAPTPVPWLLTVRSILGAGICSRDALTRRACAQGLAELVRLGGRSFGKKLVQALEKQVAKASADSAAAAAADRSGAVGGGQGANTMLSALGRSAAAGAVYALACVKRASSLSLARSSIVGDQAYLLVGETAAVLSAASAASQSSSPSSSSSTGGSSLHTGSAESAGVVTTVSEGDDTEAALVDARNRAVAANEARQCLASALSVLDPPPLLVDTISDLTLFDACRESRQPVRAAALHAWCMLVDASAAAVVQAITASQASAERFQRLKERQRLHSSTSNKQQTAEGEEGLKAAVFADHAAALGAVRVFSRYVNTSLGLLDTHLLMSSHSPFDGRSVLAAATDASGYDGRGGEPLPSASLLRMQLTGRGLALVSASSALDTQELTPDAVLGPATAAATGCDFPAGGAIVATSTAGAAEAAAAAAALAASAGGASSVGPQPSAQYIVVSYEDGIESGLVPSATSSSSTTASNTATSGGHSGPSILSPSGLLASATSASSSSGSSSATGGVGSSSTGGGASASSSSSSSSAAALSAVLPVFDPCSGDLIPPASVLSMEVHGYTSSTASAAAAAATGAASSSSAGAGPGGKAAAGAAAAGGKGGSIMLSPGSGRPDPASLAAANAASSSSANASATDGGSGAGEEDGSGGDASAGLFDGPLHLSPKQAAALGHSFQLYRHYSRLLTTVGGAAAARAIAASVVTSLESPRSVAGARGLAGAAAELVSESDAGVSAVLAQLFTSLLRGLAAAAPLWAEAFPPAPAAAEVSGPASTTTANNEDDDSSIANTPRASDAPPENSSKAAASSSPAAASDLSHLLQRCSFVWTGLSAVSDAAVASACVAAAALLVQIASFVSLGPSSAFTSGSNNGPAHSASAAEASANVNAGSLGDLLQPLQAMLLRSCLLGPGPIAASPACLIAASSAPSSSAGADSGGDSCGGATSWLGGIVDCIAQPNPFPLLLKQASASLTSGEHQQTGQHQQLHLLLGGWALALERLGVRWGGTSGAPDGSAGANAGSSGAAAAGRTFPSDGVTGSLSSGLVPCGIPHSPSSPLTALPSGAAASAGGGAEGDASLRLSTVSSALAVAPIRAGRRPVGHVSSIHSGGSGGSSSLAACPPSAPLALLTSALARGQASPSSVRHHLALASQLLDASRSLAASAQRALVMQSAPAPAAAFGSNHQAPAVVLHGVYTTLGAASDVILALDAASADVQAAEVRSLFSSLPVASMPLLLHRSPGSGLFGPSTSSAGARGIGSIISLRQSRVLSSHTASSWSGVKALLNQLAADTTHALSSPTGGIEASPLRLTDRPAPVTAVSPSSPAGSGSKPSSSSAPAHAAPAPLSLEWYRACTDVLSGGCSRSGPEAAFRSQLAALVASELNAAKRKGQSDGDGFGEDEEEGEDEDGEDEEDGDSAAAAGGAGAGLPRAARRILLDDSLAEASEAGVAARATSAALLALQSDSGLWRTLPDRSKAWALTLLSGLLCGWVSSSASSAALPASSSLPASLSSTIAPLPASMELPRPVIAQIASLVQAAAASASPAEGADSGASAVAAAVAADDEFSVMDAKSTSKGAKSEASFSVSATGASSINDGCVSPLQLASLSLLARAVTSLAHVRDPDVPSQPLLQQFQTLLVGAIAPHAAPSGAPQLQALTLPLAVIMIRSGIASDGGSVRQLASAVFDGTSDGNFNNSAVSAVAPRAVKVASNKARLLAAAQLLCAATAPAAADSSSKTSGRSAGNSSSGAMPPRSRALVLNVASPLLPSYLPAWGEQILRHLRRESPSTSSDDSGSFVATLVAAVATTLSMASLQVSSSAASSAAAASLYGSTSLPSDTLSELSVTLTAPVASAAAAFTSSHGGASLVEVAFAAALQAAASDDGRHSDVRGSAVRALQCLLTLSSLPSVPVPLLLAAVRVLHSASTSISSVDGGAAWVITGIAPFARHCVAPMTVQLPNPVYGAPPLPLQTMPLLQYLQTQKHHGLGSAGAGEVDSEQDAARSIVGLVLTSLHAQVSSAALTLAAALLSSSSSASYASAVSSLAPYAENEDVTRLSNRAIDTLALASTSAAAAASSPSASLTSASETLAHALTALSAGVTTLAPSVLEQPEAEEAAQTALADASLLLQALAPAVGSSSTATVAAALQPATQALASLISSVAAMCLYPSAHPFGVPSFAGLKAGAQTAGGANASSAPSDNGLAAVSAVVNSLLRLCSPLASPPPSDEDDSEITSATSPSGSVSSSNNGGTALGVWRWGLWPLLSALLAPQSPSPAVPPSGLGGLTALSLPSSSSGRTVQSSLHPSVTPLAAEIIEAWAASIAAAPLAVASATAAVAAGSATIEHASATISEAAVASTAALAAITAIVKDKDSASPSASQALLASALPSAFTLLRSLVSLAHVTDESIAADDKRALALAAVFDGPCGSGPLSSAAAAALQLLAAVYPLFSAPPAASHVGLSGLATLRLPPSSSGEDDSMKGRFMSLLLPALIPYLAPLPADYLLVDDEEEDDGDASNVSAGSIAESDDDDFGDAVFESADASLSTTSASSGAVTRKHQQQEKKQKQPRPLDSVWVSQSTNSVAGQVALGLAQSDAATFKASVARMPPQQQAALQSGMRSALMPEAQRPSRPRRNRVPATSAAATAGSAAAVASTFAAADSGGGSSGGGGLKPLLKFDTSKFKSTTATVPVAAGAGTTAATASPSDAAQPAASSSPSPTSPGPAQSLSFKSPTASVTSSATAAAAVAAISRGPTLEELLSDDLGLKRLEDDDEDDDDEDDSGGFDERKGEDKAEEETASDSGSQETASESGRSNDGAAADEAEAGATDATGIASSSPSHADADFAAHDDSASAADRLSFGDDSDAGAFAAEFAAAAASAAGVRGTAADNDDDDGADDSGSVARSGSIRAPGRSVDSSPISAAMTSSVVAGGDDATRPVAQPVDDEDDEFGDFGGGDDDAEIVFDSAPPAVHVRADPVDSINDVTPASLVAAVEGDREEAEDEFGGFGVDENGSSGLGFDQQPPALATNSSAASGTTEAAADALQSEELTAAATDAVDTPVAPSPLEAADDNENEEDDDFGDFDSGTGAVVEAPLSVTAAPSGGIDTEVTSSVEESAVPAAAAAPVAPADAIADGGAADIARSAAAGAVGQAASSPLMTADDVDDDDDGNGFADFAPAPELSVAPAAAATDAPAAEVFPTSPQAAATRDGDDDDGFDNFTASSSADADEGFDDFAAAEAAPPSVAAEASSSSSPPSVPVAAQAAPVQAGASASTSSAAATASGDSDDEFFAAEFASAPAPVQPSPSAAPATASAAAEPVGDDDDDFFADFESAS